MTDNEIIKHLNDYAGAPSQTGLIANIALKLIEPQTAEKEIERVRTKAIKEFAERLKEVFTTIDGTFECWEVEEHIDNLVEEMEKQNDC